MDKEINNPNYYAILTADVRYDDRLKPNEKLLFAEITALANFQGYCSASNSYFSKLYKVHKNTVGNWVNRLVELGYIKSELIFNDKKQIIARRLYITNLPINEKIDTPINEKIDTSQQKDGEGINEIIEGNNTRKNITSKNNITPIPPQGADDGSKKTNEKTSGYSEKFEQWWALYPRKTGKGAAWKKWKSEKLEKRFDELLEKLKQQNAMQHAFMNPQYIVGASRYLNEARYDDEVVFLGGKGNGVSAGMTAIEQRNREVAERFLQENGGENEF